LICSFSTYIHTYHSRFILEGVVKAFHIFLRDNHFLPKRPFDISLSQMTVGAINPFIAFYDIHGRKRCYSFILSWRPHETLLSLRINYQTTSERRNKTNITNMKTLIIFIPILILNDILFVVTFLMQQLSLFD
jgi:hypothetical protein